MSININWVFLMEMQCVYCGLAAEFTNIVCMKLQMGVSKKP